MLYILLGQDEFTLRQSLEEIKRSIGDEELSAANTTALDSRQLTMEQLRVACETAPFLTEKRLVIIYGLLERFEPESRARRRGKSARTPGQQTDYKVLVSYISNIPDTTILVLVDGRASTDNPLFRGLTGRAEVRSFPLLTGARLRQWIHGRVAEGGGNISPQAVDLLARLVGGNLWIMANEVDKLLLFSSGRRIEEEDVRMLVSQAQEANVFAMVDAILEFRSGAAEQLLHQLLQRGAAPAYLLTMLSRQVQMIVRAKELTAQGKSGGEIQNRLGLAAEFALRKTLEQAGRYSWERLKDVYQRLLEADLAIKTGRYEGELALNILIAELCQG